MPLPAARSRRRAGCEASPGHGKARIGRQWGHARARNRPPPRQPSSPERSGPRWDCAGRSHFRRSPMADKSCGRPAPGRSPAPADPDMAEVLQHLNPPCVLRPHPDGTAHGAGPRRRRGGPPGARRARGGSGRPQGLAAVTAEGRVNGQRIARDRRGGLIRCDPGDGATAPRARDAPGAMQAGACRARRSAPRGEQRPGRGGSRPDREDGVTRDGVSPRIRRSRNRPARRSASRSRWCNRATGWSKRRHSRWSPDPA